MLLRPISQLGAAHKLEEWAVKRMKIAYGNTQVAEIDLPSELANKASWVFSCVRTRTIVQRCYKCLDFKHLALYCKGPTNPNAAINVARRVTSLRIARV